MIWITREHIHVDRVACPWLISRFIDKNAQFLFMPKEEILEYAKKTGAIPFDTPGAEIHHYERDGIKYCSFDNLIEKYHLQENKALENLRKIIRAADSGPLEAEPLAIGIEAIASGAPLLTKSDHESLALEFPFYDTIYAYLQRELIVEQYKNELEKLPGRSERNTFFKEKINQSWNKN